MKKIISLLLSIVMISPIVCINASATESDNYSGINISDYTNMELDLSEFTINDIINMTSEEYLTLIRDFERVYDPYDSYIEPEENMELENSQISGETFDLQWTSGKIANNGELTESGCHEYITAQACAILASDKGFFANNATAAVVVMLSISLASLLPDKDEVSNLFAGHFYDPDTGKNYRGETLNTAKNNAINHYNAAITAANYGAMDQAYEHLGRCLHYIQDVNVPHHAANVISTGPLSSHSRFETFAFNNMESYLGSYSTISSSYYNTANSSSLTTLINSAATSAKGRINYVNNTLNTSLWASNASECLKSAARYSAMVMYKFGMVSSVPFYNT